MRRLAVATIAGSDPSGGAGLQTDLRVFSLLGVFGQTVITALTVQNSLGVKTWAPVPPDLVRAQLEALFEDYPPYALKTGMLANEKIIAEVADVLSSSKAILVVDPVMLAKDGSPLLEEKAQRILKERLFPLAHVVTPNLPEAEALVGPGEARDLALKICQTGAKAVVLKGGHREGKEVKDLLFDGKDFFEFRVPRVKGKVGHGTGCTFSAALTVFLAQGLALPEAVAKAQNFVYLGLLSASYAPLGQGVSPLDHLIHWERLKEKARVIESLEKAAQEFCANPVRSLIPEVQTNLAYALPLAQNQREVAAFPGRIVALGERAQPVGCPAFGASRHVANVVLAAMKHDPSFRAAMNIRLEETFLHRARTHGLKIGEFSREEEPLEIKQREGSTLSWGVDLVCRRLGYVPDLIVDRGEVGKEPMIRVLGRNPEEVVKKALKLLG